LISAVYISNLGLVLLVECFLFSTPV